MDQITRDYITINGGKTYFEIAGQGDWLVLGHAGIVDSGMWDEQMAFFSRHFRVVRYDMRGFGKSDPVEGPMSRRQELGQLMQQLSIEKAALVGCSLSGEAVLDFALEHAEKVAALVLVSTVPSGFEMMGEPPAEMLGMFAAMEQGDLQRVTELQMRLSIDGPFRQPEQVNQDVRQAAAAMNRIAVANRTAITADLQPLDPPALPAAHRLSEVHAPTLIVAGALDHPELLRAAAWMEKGIANARKVILPESAHLPNMERPAEFNEAVLEFLWGEEKS
jgi:2-hydroxy-6-oxonona-2,4-dienedioate hydrolase